MEKHNAYDKIIIGINKRLIRFLMGVLTLCIILGSLDLVRVIYDEVIHPPFVFLNVSNLLGTFNLILIIAVGYELVKSLHTLIVSPVIPAIPLVQIGIIALSNKMITIDFKAANPEKLYGMAVIMFSLGVSYFFLQKQDTVRKKEEQLENLKEVLKSDRKSELRRKERELREMDAKNEESHDENKNF